MLTNTSSRGQIAVLKICLECARRNIVVCFPSVEGTRFDCIIDIDGKLLKTQIKYLNRLAGKNCLELRIEDKRYNKKCYTEDEIDIILVYVPKIDTILCFHPNDFHNKKTIRINLNNEQAPTFYKKFLW